MDMERVPGLNQLTDMWESDDEPEDDGVGYGQGGVERRWRRRVSG
jgi:hypothetical protein